jgi:hypothetical protein
MLRRVALVRTDVSEELSASFIRVTRIGERGTTLAVTNIVPSSPILVTLMNEALSSSETSVLTRATERNLPEDAILHLPDYTASHSQWQMITHPMLAFLGSSGKWEHNCPMSFVIHHLLPSLPHFMRELCCVYVLPSITAMQLRSKHALVAMNTHATTEELSQATFLCGVRHAKFLSCTE